MNIFKAALPIIATSLLVACGGGGGGSDGSTVVAQSSGIAGAQENVLLLAGTGTVVEGTISTSKYLLQSMSWHVTAMTPNAADLTLTNQTCSAATKQDSADPIMPVGSGYGTSTWTCSLGVASSVNVTQNTVYQLVLEGIDRSGQSTTISKTLTVEPNAGFVPSNTALNLAIAGNLVGAPGQTLNLTASPQWASSAQTPLIYTWSLGAGTAGNATLLSTTGSSVQLYLTPGQTTSTRIPVTVTATGTGVAASATMLVVVQPGSFNIQTAGSLLGKPGDVLNLGAIAQWTDTTASGNTPVIYSWSLGSGSAGLATLLSTTGSNVQLYLSPTSLGQPVPATVPVTVTATGNGATASATMYAVIDPFAPLDPKISEPVVDVAPGCRTELTASATGAAFYRWTVVDQPIGPTVTLGGDNTLLVGFFAPAAEQVMRVRFAAGYYPIDSSYAGGTTAPAGGTSTSYPGVYSVDGLVRVIAGGPCPSLH